MDRVPGFEPVGWGFKSSVEHQFFVNSMDLNGAFRKQSGGLFLARGVIAALPPALLRIKKTQMGV